MGKNRKLAARMFTLTFLPSEASPPASPLLHITNLSLFLFHPSPFLFPGSPLLPSLHIFPLTLLSGVRSSFTLFHLGLSLPSLSFFSSSIIPFTSTFTSQKEAPADSSADSEKRRKNKTTGANFPQQGKKVGAIVVSGRGTKQCERKWADPEPPAVDLTK